MQVTAPTSRWPDWRIAVICVLAVLGVPQTSLWLSCLCERVHPKGRSTRATRIQPMRVASISNLWRLTRAAPARSQRIFRISHLFSIYCVFCNFKATWFRRTFPPRLVVLFRSVYISLPRRWRHLEFTRFGGTWSPFLLVITGCIVRLKTK